MANFEEFKRKAKDAFDTLADVSVETYRIAEEKARVLARRAKLNTEITRERGLIRRLRYDIGCKYYELHKDDPEEALAKNCEGITDSFARIAAKKNELFTAILNIETTFFSYLRNGYWANAKAAADNAYKEAEKLLKKAGFLPTGIFGTNPKWDGAWWHYILFFVLFGWIWMW